MNARLDRVVEDQAEETDKRESIEKRFVTMEHFRGVVEPMQHDLRELGRDIKKILEIVSRGGNRSARLDP